MSKNHFLFRKQEILKRILLFQNFVYFKNQINDAITSVVKFIFFLL